VNIFYIPWMLRQTGIPRNKILNRRESGTEELSFCCKNKDNRRRKTQAHHEHPTLCSFCMNTLFWSGRLCASRGLPLVNQDVCLPPAASQSSRSLLPCPSQQPQPQIPPQTALLPTPQQHPMGNHMIAQVWTFTTCIHIDYIRIINTLFEVAEDLI